MKEQIKTAIITGASRGLGLALARTLAEKGWNLVINSRNAKALYEVQKELSKSTQVVAISGDVRDEVLLLQFPDQLKQFGRLDLLINNASTLGASPQPHLLDYPIEAIHQIFHTNVIAPLSLIQKIQKWLRPNSKIINISSDAAVAAYPGWGGYGASKAALDHLSAIMAQEQPDWNIYWVDPGDMRTQMHQEAFPGEDISDRPLPESTLPAFLHLIENEHPSGRYVVPQMLQVLVNNVALTT